MNSIPIRADPGLLEEHEPLSSDYIHRLILPDRFVVGHTNTIDQTNVLYVFFETAALLKSEPTHFLIGDGSLKASYLQASA
ncbi:GT4_WbuB-like domain containing protein [Sphingomonadaceae bacterium]